MVSGLDASQVWKDSFAKLAQEEMDSKDFDSVFYQQINNDLEVYHAQSFTEHSNELDAPIRVEEVQLAIKKLKKGKASGVDGIINEIFKYGGEKTTIHLWKLINNVFMSEVFPIQWSRGLIYPLFKGGPEEARLDPGKYRGITLLSVVGKIYSSVLNNRLSIFCEKNNLLSDEQAGFRPERSTSDQLFTLTELIKHRRPKPTYCAFIDLAKAYDKVWRGGLWYKLYNLGIRGKMWRVLKNMYINVESSVLLGNNKTEWFKIMVGLRQGCVLSPLLFNLFINDLQKELQSINKGVWMDSYKLSMLYFADDIVLLAESKDDLESMLQIVFNYSIKWRVKLNDDKCNVVVFHNIPNKSIYYDNCINQCNCNHHYKFGNNLIKEVLIYKYLGIELDYRLTLSVYKSRIISKAKSNLGRIWHMGIKGNHLSVKGSLNLYYALVRSQLEYGTELWEWDLFPDAEKIQIDMGKRILGCSSHTTHATILGDLGWGSLLSRRNFRKLIYWYHIMTLDNNRIIKRVYLSTMHNNIKTSWVAGIKKLLLLYGLNNIFKNPNNILFNLDGKGNMNSKSILDHKKFWRKFIKNKILDQERVKWLKNVNEHNKLRNYKIFKTNLKLEKYLQYNTPFVEGRKYHFKLRSGTVDLEVEKGRWKGIKLDQRLCTHCSRKEIEDEKHFLLTLFEI